EVWRRRDAAGPGSCGRERRQPQSRRDTAIESGWNARRDVGWGPSFLMSQFAEPMARLIAELKKLTGVGAKSAQRLEFNILSSSSEDAEALADSVRELKEKLRLCSICTNITDLDPCPYCA